MKQGQFESLYKENWQQFRAMLDALAPLESPKVKKKDKTDKKEVKRKAAAIQLSDAEFENFSRLYRKVCHYHTLANERNYSSALVDRLGELVVRGYQVQYRRTHNFKRQLMLFFVRDFPRLIRQEWRYVFTAHALLYLPAILLFFVIAYSPEMVYTIMSPQQVSQFEGMYDPANKVLGAARDSESNWMMFGYYINNNIGVSFRCFASGLLACVGSLFFLVYNGLLFGAVAGHLNNLGFDQTFWTFVIAHGSFELTAIAFSGAAGLKLGMAILAPGNFTRVEALKRSGRVAIKIMYGVILMLLAAAFVEAFWSSSNVFEAWQKYFAGAVLWFVVIIYFVIGGRRGS